MKTPMLVFFTLATLGAGGLHRAQERQIGGVGLLVFADAAYRGLNATFRQDTPNLRAAGLDNRISSLQAAPGELWEVCDLVNYGGRCQVFSGSEPNLRSRGWDDIISSVRRVSGGGFPPVPPVPGGLELFAGPRFTGDRRSIANPIADLRQIGFDNRAVSLRLGSSQNWEVCADTGFRDCRVVNTDWPQLSGLGMNRQISSVRPWSMGGGGGAPQPGPIRLILFDERNFRGRSISLDAPTPFIATFSNRAESAQVIAGSWEICDRAGFSGRCQTITGDVRDLRALGLNNRVASARPRPDPR